MHASPASRPSVEQRNDPAPSAMAAFQNSPRSRSEGKFLSLLPVFILLLIAGSIEIGHVTAKSLLETDAQTTADAWAEGMTRTVENLPSIIEGHSPSENLANYFEDASHFGDVYYFLLRDRYGKIILRAGKPDSFPIGSDINITRSLHLGRKLTTIVRPTTSSTPSYYGVSLIPIKSNSRVIGLFEVHVDVTDAEAMYRKTILATEGAIIMVVILAGGLPTLLLYQKTLAHARAKDSIRFVEAHDRLTGLYNRHGLETVSRLVLAENVRNRSYSAILLLDLHRFRKVNEGFGHEGGNTLLRSFASRLCSATRRTDIVARLGADEFAILQVGMTQPSGARALSDRLMKLLAEPYEIASEGLFCEATIGVAIAPDDAQDLDSLLRCASTALQRAKQQNRKEPNFFEADMDAAFRERRQIERELQRAFKEGALHLEYQPLVRLHNGRLTGFEALLRWPAHWGFLSPEVFIPVAEECGLIVPIGSWVLESACQAAVAWPSPLKIAVNISPVQFTQGDIVSSVEHALRTSGLEAARLELEITESLWLQDSHAVLQQLKRLNAIGVSICLDDFGTGYSSLSYLWKFPFNKVKIDRTFALHFPQDARASAIVRAIIALGKALELTVLAEGIETHAQVEALRDCGCDEAQGYFFGRPLAPETANEIAYLHQGEWGGSASLSAG